MSESRNNFTSLNPLRGWLLDLYPSALGEMTLWFITEKGERVRLIDRFQPKIYVSGNIADLSKLTDRLRKSKAVVKWVYADKYADFMDDYESKVLEITLTDCCERLGFARKVLRLGGYKRFRLHNVDVPDTQLYLFERDLFPLAFVGVTVEGKRLACWLLDSVESVDYRLPPLSLLELNLEVTKKKLIPSFSDEIKNITIQSNGREIVIAEGSERQKLLSLVEVVQKEDPDIFFTDGGDSFLFPYLIQRARANNVLYRLILGREAIPLRFEKGRGASFFSYGRVFFKAPMHRLYGRVHIDTRNTFIHSSSGLQGLIEVARTCRVPLHRAVRASIGTIMSSLQLYQATKDNILIPWKKNEPESYKSGWELLIADRGGFIFEPKVGIHDNVVEVDFVSMFPTLMATRNISAETIQCKCCPTSPLRVPELGYNVCRKREGIVPKTLWLILRKRRMYKELKNGVEDSELKETYAQRQGALKWILVTCFGYLGYKNARFGKVDAHIAVCAFARDVLLRAVRMAEERGFEVIHGIVDSLWLKKENAELKDYAALCGAVSREVGVQLNVEGRYRWIVFLPSKTHLGVPVLNRYYGVFDSGEIKTRGIDIRKSDTPKFIHGAQLNMIEVLARARDSEGFLESISEALSVLRAHAKKLIDREVCVEDLLIIKRLSLNPSEYTHDVLQAISAKRLVKEGVEVSAGQTVQYLITNAESKSAFRRVLPAQFVKANMRYDVSKYLDLLLSSAHNILSPFGYTMNNLRALLYEQKQEQL